jgi:hypothetical protein
MCELLWTDPQEDNGRGPSKRGMSVVSHFDEIDGSPMSRRGYWIRTRCDQEMVRAEWDHWVSSRPLANASEFTDGDLSILRSHEVRQGLQRLVVKSGFL